jgi:hypothetical protein
MQFSLSSWLQRRIVTQPLLDHASFESESRESERKKRLGLCWSRRLEIKAITQNHFGNQVVGRTGETHAEAEIDLPLRCDI